MTPGRVVDVVLWFAAAVLLAVGGVSVAGSVTRCHAAGDRSGIATHWSPMNGCTAVILGTEVRV